MFTKLLVGAVAAGTMSVPLAGVAWADVAISVGGIPVDDGGPSTAVSVGPNLAIAFNNSTASATGFGNVVIASNNSNAGEGLGFLNTTIADNNSSAVGLFNVGNNTFAQNGSTVQTGGSFFNTVRATNNSSAGVFNGRFNFVTASDGSTANLSGANGTNDGNIVTARCGGSVVLEAQSNKIVTSAPCETG